MRVSVRLPSQALCSQERPCQHIGLRKKDRGTVKSNSTDVWDDRSGRRRRSAAGPCTGHVVRPSGRQQVWAACFLGGCARHRLLGLPETLVIL